MKKCPTCQMIVDAENECPICGATLTYEPTINSEKEHIILNKYYWIYLAKETWFSILCSIVCIVRVMIVGPQISPLLLGMIGLLVISIVVSIFRRNWVNAMQWKYTENHAGFKTSLWKYLFAAIAVLFAFFVK